MRMLTKPAPPAEETVRGNPGEKSACSFAFEDKFRQQRCRAKRQDSKVRERYRMLWPMQHWLQKLNRQIFPVPRQRFHQAPIRARIFVQLFRRNIDVFEETGAEPLSSGCANGISGSIHLRPKRSSGSVLKNGEPLQVDELPNRHHAESQAELVRPTRAAADCRVAS